MTQETFCESWGILGEMRPGRLCFALRIPPWRARHKSVAQCGHGRQASVSQESPAFLNGPLAAAVESAIVGYTTLPMEAGKWYMVGTPFDGLREPSEPLTINDVFENKGFADGDILYRLDAQGAFVPQWWMSGEEHVGWSTSRRRWSPDAKAVQPGEAFYIWKDNSPGNVVFAGKVEAKTVSFGSETGQAWNMVTPHWPEAKSLNDLVWGNLSTDDKLYRLNASGDFVPYFWYSNGENTGWSKSQRRWNPDNLPLGIGEAVYVNKVSASQGTLSN